MNDGPVVVESVFESGEQPSLGNADRIGGYCGGIMRAMEVPHSVPIRSFDPRSCQAVKGKSPQLS